MSYKLSSGYFTAQLSGDPYVSFVVITTAKGNHIFHNGGITALNLPPEPNIHISQRLESVSDMVETLMPNGSDMFSNYTQSERQDCTVTLADTDRYFAAYFEKDTFLNATMTIKCGFPSLAYTDLFTLFSGEIEEEVFTSSGLSLRAVVNGSILRQLHTLGTASRYARPLNPEQTLPKTYGARRYLPTRGVWECPCIDTTNFIYLINDDPVVSVANGNVIAVYVDDVLVTTGYTVTTSGADENGKTIAYLTFTATQGSSIVTIKCQGKPATSGAFMGHPLDVISDIITYAGGSSTDFDATSWAIEYDYALTQGLEVSNTMIHGSRLVQELVLEILASFAASSWITPEGKLKFRFPRYTANQSEIALFLREQECFDFSASRLTDNICNSLTWNYRWITWKDRYATTNEVVTDANPNLPALSISRYGTFFRNLDAGWNRRVESIAITQRSLFYQYAFPRWIITLTTTDTRAMQLERGDIVCFSWEGLNDENMLPLINQIGRVLEITRNVISGTTVLKLHDTGEYYTGSGTTRIRTRY